MLDKLSSLRLTAIRFPLIVGVVFIHNYDSAVNMGGAITGAAVLSPWVDFIKNVISQGVARLAVPIFFLISGFLFFKDGPLNKHNYTEKIKSRVNTLLIPFLFWNLLTLAITAIAQSSPETRHFFSGRNKPLTDFTLYDYLNTVIGFDKRPIAYQFWFIRDLIILAILSPIIYLLTRYAAIVYIPATLISWFLNAPALYAPGADAIFFFSLGTWTALNNKSPFILDKWGTNFSLIYGTILLIDALSKSAPWSQQIHNLGILTGIPTALYATRYIATTPSIREIFLSFSASSFFVFAAHEPLLIIIKKISLKATHNPTSLLALIYYIAIPSILIYLLLIIQRILSKKAPTFLSVITGNVKPPLKPPNLIK